MKHELQNIKNKYRQIKWWLRYYQSEIVGGFVLFGAGVLLASLVIGG